MKSISLHNWHITWTSQLGPLTRSDFWFNDGNIILIARPFAFKVHRGQLERHSEVFMDLFSVPQPEDQDLIDGSSWVELFDDPSHVFHFLKALYDGVYYNEACAEDFAVIAAVLRLSTKYLVEHLRQQCLFRMYQDWPSTLERWDKREFEATDKNGSYMPRDLCPHPILVIELAMELNYASILPAAFYDLSRYDPSRIICGTYAPQLPQPVQQISNPPLRAVLLSKQLLHCALRGRECSKRYLFNFIERELRNRSVCVDCLNQHDNESRHCHESFYFIMLNMLRSICGVSCGREADPLFSLIQAMDMLSRTDFSDGQTECSLRMCHPCKIDFAASVIRAREEIWRLLPGWFGLQDLSMNHCPVPMA